MTLNIRSDVADALAEELARIDGTTINEAVIVALRETIESRLRQETPTQTAQRILARRGLSFQTGRLPVPEEAYHAMDHDLTGES
jgi:hypothetical protein